jgi:hypothetical protein
MGNNKRRKQEISWFELEAGVTPFQSKQKLETMSISALSITRRPEK